MNNKSILKIYGTILVALSSTLIILCVVSFLWIPSAISALWGNDTSLWGIIVAIVTNLLYGLIASAALAFFIAIISYQYDIRNAERSYLSDICQIELLCRDAITEQKVDHLFQFLKLYERRHKQFLDSELYMKSIFHTRKGKNQVANSIEEISSQIEHINQLCQGILGAYQQYNKIQEEYTSLSNQMLFCHHYKKEYSEYRKKAKGLLNALEKHRLSKDREIEQLSNLSRELYDFYNELDGLL